MTSFHRSLVSSSIKLSLVCASLLTISVYATAATITAQTALNVSAEVVASCMISSATAVTLSGQAFNTPGIGSGTVAIQCTNGTEYDVLLDQGAGGVGATTASRILTGAVLGQTMTYGLYQDSGNSIPWGNTPGTDTLHKTGTGLVQDWTVNMKVLSGLGVAAADTYADTVNVTVQY
jgi:spore coat protein U-like protein